MSPLHNLRTVFAFEFLRTIKKRTFWISVLAVPVMFGLVIGISFFSSQNAERAEESRNKEVFTVQVLDESGLVSAATLQGIGATTVADRETGAENVRAGRVDAFFYYPSDPSKDQIEVFVKDEGLFKNGKYETAAKQLLISSVVAELGSEQRAAIVRGQADTTLTAYNNGQVTPGFGSVIAPGIFLIMFYLLIIMLGNQMLSSTTEEKENRVIEMILTTVEARVLIIGKILSMILLGLVQLTLTLAPAIIAYVFFRNVLQLPNIDLAQVSIDPWRMLVGGAIFLFSFLLFTGVLVTIGAAMPTAREAGGFFGMMMFFTFVPLYAAATIVTDPGQLIVKIFSFFPMTAPITLMLRNAVGNLTSNEIALGIGILVASSALTLFMAIRAFRRGTLEYDRKLKFRELFAK